MSSQKIGPNSLASRARFCTGAVESSDSILPTTGLVGGCGIGLNRLVDAIVNLFPCLRHCEERSDEAIHTYFAAMDCFTSLAMTRYPNRFLRHSISFALTSSG